MHLADPQCLERRSWSWSWSPTSPFSIFIFEPTARIASPPVLYAPLRTHKEPQIQIQMPRYVYNVLRCRCGGDVAAAAAAAAAAAPGWWTFAGSSCAFVGFVGSVAVPLCATNENADRQRAPTDDSGNSNSNSSNISNTNSNIGSKRQQRLTMTSHFWRQWNKLNPAHSYQPSSLTTVSASSLFSIYLTCIWIMSQLKGILNQHKKNRRI